MIRCWILFLILAWAAILTAQETAQALGSPVMGTITGHVFSNDGTRLGGATVTITGSNESTFVTATDPLTDPGKFTSPAIAAGKYKIKAEKDGFRSPQPKEVDLGTDVLTVDLVLEDLRGSCGPREAWKDLWPTVIAVFLFLSSIWLVRWNNIARPNREMLGAEIENARARFENETGKPVPADLEQLLKSAQASITFDFWRTTIDFLFWSRGQEITGWSRIREFQRDAIKELPWGSLETVRARLQSAQLDLLDIDKTHAKTIAANIKDALGAAQPVVAASAVDPRLDADQQAKLQAERNIEQAKRKSEWDLQQERILRAQLVEALAYLNDEDVNTFAQLVGWQTKAVWLAGVGCALVVALSFAVGNPVLFIAGGAGGYLSRLARTLKRADVPTDYGASWTTLFLSPIVGGLSGWFGILLIVVLADTRFNVLGAAFQAVKWCAPLAPFTLGIAFAMGFSERLFDGIISSLEEKVDKDREAATKPAQTGTSSTSKQQPPAAATNLALAPVTEPESAPAKIVPPVADPAAPAAEDDPKK
jgi:Carboxypeptidase regulatory-like domain